LTPFEKLKNHSYIYGIKQHIISTLDLAPAPIFGKILTPDPLWLEEKNARLWLRPDSCSRLY